MRTGGAHRERGESLVELLVAIAILGVAAAGVMGAVLMVARASTLTGQGSRAAIIVRNWAERIEAGDYVPCATTRSLTTPPGDTGWSGRRGRWTRTVDGATFEATVVRVEHWRPATQSFASSCSSDSGLQRVTVSVAATGGELPSAPEQLVVVVRNPCRATDEVGCSS